MSLRYEQYRALKMTREFLHELMLSKKPIRKKELREGIRRCLRHYPFLEKNGKPMFSNDNIEA